MLSNIPQSLLFLWKLEDQLKFDEGIYKSQLSVLKHLLVVNKAPVHLEKDTEADLG